MGRPFGYVGGTARGGRDRRAALKPTAGCHPRARPRYGGKDTPGKGRAGTMGDARRSTAPRWLPGPRSPVGRAGRSADALGCKNADRAATVVGVGAPSYAATRPRNGFDGAVAC